MKQLLITFIVLSVVCTQESGQGKKGEKMAFELDYDKLILLDAEDLAEGGIKQAYLNLLPQLKALLDMLTFIVEPRPQFKRDVVVV